MITPMASRSSTEPSSAPLSVRFSGLFQGACPRLSLATNATPLDSESEDTMHTHSNAIHTGFATDPSIPGSTLMRPRPVGLARYVLQAHSNPAHPSRSLETSMMRAATGLTVARSLVFPACDVPTMQARPTPARAPLARSMMSCFGNETWWSSGLAL